MKKNNFLIVQAITGINYKLLLFLALGSLIPLLYSNFRIYWIGQINDDSTFNIAAQVTWLSLLYEVLNEALLLPLAFILGQVIRDKMQWSKRITVTLSIFLAIYLVVTVLFLIFAPYTVSFMQQQVDLYFQTIKYVRLEAVAILLSSLFSYFQLILILQNKRKVLYLLLILQSVLILIVDGVLVSSFSFSLQLGLTGIALCNIVVSSVLACISCLALYTQGVRFYHIQFKQHLWLKEYFKKATVSCIESGIRNTVFALIILKMINMAESSGDFWLMNQFIWGWLLLPVFAISQLVKQDAAIHQGLSTAKINAYLILMTVVIFAWFCSMPWWEGFIYHIMGIEQAHHIAQLAIGMIGCYMLFAWNSVLDQYFYGIGRIDLILYQTVIINTLFYGTIYILHSIQFFEVTLSNILLIFGFSLVLDSILTCIQYIRLQYLQGDRQLNVQ